jgi:hypothetical protein
MRKWQAGVVALLRAMRKFMAQTETELAAPTDGCASRRCCWRFFGSYRIADATGLQRRAS